MLDSRKTKTQLIAELEALRSQVAAGEDPATYAALEKRVRESEQRFNSFIEGSLQGILVHRDFRILIANQALADMLGYDSGESMAGMDVAALVPPDELDTRREYYARRMANQEAPAQFEGGALRRDGTLIQLRMLARVVDWEGAPAAQITMVDLTERRRAEEERRRSEQLLRGFIDSATESFLLFDSNLRFLDCNKTYVRRVGLPKEQIIGRYLPEIIPTAIETGRYDRVKAVLETGRPDEFEALVQSPRLGERYMLLNVFPAGNDTVGVIGTDITVRKRAEEALRENEGRMRLLTDAVPVAIAYVDRYEHYRFGNRTIENWMASGSGGIAGRHVGDVIPSEDYETIRPHIAAALRGETVTFEGRFEFPDGQPRDRRVVYIPDFGPDGKVRGFSVMAEDITERKKLEEQLLRTQKLEAVGELAGGVAHEFNNLLQIITASVDILMDFVAGDERNIRILQSIKNASERGAVLVRQMLGFARRQMLQPTVLDVNEEISSIVHLITSTMGERVQLIFRPGADLSRINTDSGTFEQILVNLCINSRDAMPEGGRLTLETANAGLDEAFAQEHAWARVGRFVRITVADTGEGMAPEVMERIFEPFFSTKGPQKGSGLGLSMVYGVIQQQAGLIDVSSKPGSGTAFHIYFPALTDATGGSAEKDAEDAAPTMGTILVVEDQRQLQQLTAQILENNDFKVINGFNGEEAVQLFEANKAEISMVLLDLVMPKLGGRQAYERIRELCPEVPVLFQTGYDPSEDDWRFLSDHGLKLLRKPYSMRDLLTAVRELLPIAPPSQS